jgi:hypothetical protein
MTKEQIARVCHDANNALRRALDEPETPWEEGRDSSIRGVEHALAHPNETPEGQHQQWFNDKVADGWTYAPGPKNVAAKTHPQLVPYSDLPAEQRAKDVLFQGIVKGLAPLLRQ